ncbi:MAG: hypothetical protein U0935_19395 [Pirellulales bacterium]
MRIRPSPLFAPLSGPLLGGLLIALGSISSTLAQTPAGDERPAPVAPAQRTPDAASPAAAAPGGANPDDADPDDADSDEFEPAANGEPPPLDPDQLRRLAESLLKKHLPLRYEDAKQWGQTKRVSTGLKVSLDGLRVDSERRTKEVNHGTWKRYRIDQVPGPDSLQLTVRQCAKQDDGKLRVELDCVARLLVSGRVAQWERGVQLLNIGAEGDAVVRLSVGGELAVMIDLLKLPPDVTLRPQVTDARLELIDFRLRRLGHLHGPVSRQLGEALEELLQARIADENRSLPDKLNRQLAKKPERWRFSLSEWATRKWDSLSR